MNIDDNTRLLFDEDKTSSKGYFFIEKIFYRNYSMETMETN